MKQYKCKICGSSDKDSFYNSIRTYCKTHWKEKVKINRDGKKEQYQEYERSRAHLPHRVALRNPTNNGKIGLYCVIPKGHESRDDSSNALAYVKRKPKDQIKRPNLYKAHLILHNALRSNLITKGVCEVCGTTKHIHGHHEDYLKPLSIRWLCATHHRQWHIENGEAKNP